MKIAVEVSRALITDAKIHARKIHAVQMQFAQLSISVQAAHVYLEWWRAQQLKSVVCDRQHFHALRIVIVLTEMRVSTTFADQFALMMLDVSTMKDAIVEHVNRFAEKTTIAAVVKFVKDKSAQLAVDQTLDVLRVLRVSINVVLIHAKIRPLVEVIQFVSHAIISRNALAKLHS